MEPPTWRMPFLMAVARGAAAQFGAGDGLPGFLELAVSLMRLGSRGGRRGGSGSTPMSRGGEGGGARSFGGGGGWRGMPVPGEDVIGRALTRSCNPSVLAGTAR